VATLEELRTMILVLRAAGAGPTELVPQPRLTDLPRLVAESEVDAVLHLFVPDDAALPEPVERAAYRTVQEALTNVRKHAPGSEVTVRLHAQGGSLIVQVRNGPPEPGAEPLLLPGGGHGLIGLRERAQQLGGTLVSRSTVDGGFLVHAELPTGVAAP